MKQNKKIPVEVYSRVVGYFRPVSQWNKGKRQEFKERHTFNPDEIINNLTKGDNNGISV
ncbi:MAG: hypothetical protein JW864_06155 [Spirochaetes bacterium]|nr:hypothetical protein [Spirochaetota bacterium]